MENVLRKNIKCRYSKGFSYISFVDKKMFIFSKKIDSLNFYISIIIALSIFGGTIWLSLTILNQEHQIEYIFSLSFSCICFVINTILILWEFNGLIFKKQKLLLEKEFNTLVSEWNLYSKKDFKIDEDIRIKVLKGYKRYLKESRWRINNKDLRIVSFFSMLFYIDASVNLKIEKIPKILNIHHQDISESYLSCQCYLQYNNLVPNYYQYILNFAFEKICQ
ncbi:hypothetical protein [Mesoplasma syrphidae]|nr:hypothetical protein [Mesoplasma syrphidae]